MSMRLTMLPALLALLAVAFSLLPSTALAKPDNNPARDEFAVRVVSSAPHQVTGGDARLHIEVPRTVPPHQVEVWVNGVVETRRKKKLRAGDQVTFDGQTLVVEFE